MRLRALIAAYFLIVLGLAASAAFATDPSVLMGVPQPSAAPSCGLRQAGIYGDPGGCVYACANGSRTTIAGVVCAFPTTAATATP